MRHSTHTIFDEFVPKGTTSGNPVYTGAQHNAQLGRHNQLGIQAVIDNLTANGATAQKLVAFVEVSNDGRNWIQRSDQTSGFSTTDADLTLQFVSSTNSVQRFWSDACEGKSINGSTTTIAGPLLGFVRVRMFFDSDVVAGHVRLTVTQRDT